MEDVINENEGDTMNEVSVLHLPVEDAVNEVVHGLEGVALKHSDSRLPFQIFPDPCEEEEVPVKMRGRLPSIVVEPTDIIDVESGELRWPPESLQKEKKEDMLEEDVEEETTDEQTEAYCSESVQEVPKTGSAKEHFFPQAIIKSTGSFKCPSFVKVNPRKKQKKQHLSKSDVYDAGDI